MRRLCLRIPAKATWDDATGMNYVEYTESGTVHKIWIEDAKSLELKMKAVSVCESGWSCLLELGLKMPLCGI